MNLTNEEKQWLRKVQNLLNKCPPRFGFYTVGDPNLGVFDKTKECLFDEDQDMVLELDKHDAFLAQLDFPVNVHGVRG